MKQGASQPSDQLLVQRAQLLGDHQAFGLLVQRHQGPLRNYLRRLTGGDHALADDLAQEAFVRAYRGLRGFRGESRFRTWLVRLAYRLFLDQVESRKRLEETVLTAGDVESVHSDQALLERQTALAIDLDRALQLLTPHQRQVVLHCHFAGLTHQETAESLGMPVATVQSHLRRALLHLRPALQEWKAREGGDHHER